MQTELPVEAHLNRLDKLTNFCDSVLKVKLIYYAIQIFYSNIPVNFDGNNLQSMKTKLKINKKENDYFIQSCYIMLHIDGEASYLSQ